MKISCFAAAVLCVTLAVIMGPESPSPAVSIAGSADPVPPTGSLAERVISFNESIDSVNRPSGVLRIMRGDSLLLETAFGYANIELGVPNTNETRFGIASITKEMTRLVAWQILSEGKCQPATPLSSFLPDFPLGNDITIEHLMRHRAGIPHRVTEESETWRPVTAADMARFAARHRLMTTPGAESFYSSAGYSVLARVIEIIERKPFSEVLAERVFRPAGMDRTVDADGRTLVNGRAAAYMPGLDGLLNAPLQDLSYLVGAGSVISTAADLEKFFRAYRRGVFGPNAWSLLQPAGRITWLGATNGFHSFLTFDPETELLVIFTGNTFGGGATQLRDAIPDLLARRPVSGKPRPTNTIKVNPDQLREYSGRYASRAGSRMTVGVRDGQLTLEDSVMPALSDSEFFFQNWSRSITFVKDDSTGGWRIRNTGWDGRIEVWPRIP